jgi:HD-GYP domain-containing protein (c-di-GMP phosphodiesterase class II)
MADAPVSNDERFRHCLEIQRRVSSERNLARLAQVVMSEVTALLGADRSTLFLFDWNTMELRANFAEGIEGRALVVPLRMGIVGTAILRREITNVSNAYASPYFNPEVDSILGYRTESLLVVPLLASDGRILGGLELLNKTAGHFSVEDEALTVETAARLARWIEAGDAYPAGVEAEVIALRNTVVCDRGTVFVLEEGSGRLVAIHADGGDGRAISLNMKLGIAGLTAVTGRSMRVDEAWGDPRFDRSVDQRTGYRTRSMLCVPLKSATGESIGVVQAINKHGGVFSEDDLTTLEAVAGIVAISIENATLFADQEQQFHSMLGALAASIDAKDGSTAGHSTNVALHAVAIGVELGFSTEELDLLRVAAMLHDYGKIGINDNVLKKEGSLDTEEFAHMQSHVSLTEDILTRIHFTRKYRNVPLIAASHHERLDGSGYPRGLTEREIPFMAKILTVADVFEALTADRHYRKRMSTGDAMAILEEGAGTRFDSNVIAALRACLAARAPQEATGKDGSEGSVSFDVGLPGA